MVFVVADDDSGIRLFKFKMVDYKSRISKFFYLEIGNLTSNLSYFKHFKEKLEILQSLITIIKYDLSSGSNKACKYKLKCYTNSLNYLF